MSAQHLQQLGLNMAWVAAAITRDHLAAAAMAEGRFIFDPDFAAWSQTQNPYPSTVATLVIDDVATSSWHTKTSGDVTGIVPVQRLERAEKAGRLEDEFVEMFAEVFARWARVNNRPAPPAVTVATPLPGAYIDSVLSSQGPALLDEGP